MGGINSGRPKGSTGGGHKIPKTNSGVSMTREAWVILQQRSQQAGVSKSEYIESLIRRGDASVYDLVCQFLTDHYLAMDAEALKLKKQIYQLDLQLSQLENRNREIRDFLLQIGVSPNQIPD